VCIQSGVGLDLVNRKNTGKFSLERLRMMNEICKKFNKKSKEHNGDYLSKEDILIRFENGLNSLNIGPEIAQIETSVYLEIMTNSEMEDFYQICLESKKWEKWVTSDFDTNDKEKLITVCGHYNFNKLNTQFINLSSLDNINDIVKEKIKDKLKELLSYV
jgi:hypothetical protein